MPKSCGGIFMGEVKVKIARRGPFQVELKLEYPIARKKKIDTNTYDFTGYFFIPSQLGINSSTYSSEDFFEDYFSYTRFSILDFSLDDLLNHHIKTNPLWRIDSLISDYHFEKPQNREAIIYELKTFYNIFHDRMDILKSEFRKLKHKVDEEDYHPIEIFQNYRDKIGKVFDEFHKYHDFFYDDRQDEELRWSYRWVDEGVYLDYEKWLWYVYDTALIGREDELVEICAAEIRANIDYRKEQEYLHYTYKYNNKKNESFIFREHSIRKWAELNLHMSRTDSRNPKQVSLLLISISTGIAMFIFLLLTLLIVNKFMNQPALWILSGVLAYVLRDQIKDNLKEYSKKMSPIFAADREQYLIDPKSRKRSGFSREWMSFTRMDRLPVPIKELRERDKNKLDKYLLSENIVRFEKRTIFKSRRLTQNHPRLPSVTDILRFDLRRCFHKMDTAVEDLCVLNEENRLETVQAQRVYHIGLILSITEKDSGTKTPVYSDYRYRIVASGDEILRIERVKG